MTFRHSLTTDQSGADLADLFRCEWGVCGRQVELPLSPQLNCRGGEAPPPWFKPEVFTQPDFDADAYIADLRRNVRLHTLLVPYASTPPPPLPGACAIAECAAHMQVHVLICKVFRHLFCLHYAVDLPTKPSWSDSSKHCGMASRQRSPSWHH